MADLPRKRNLSELRSQLEAARITWRWALAIHAQVDEGKELVELPDRAIARQNAIRQLEAARDEYRAALRQFVRYRNQ